MSACTCIRENPAGTGTATTAVHDCPVHGGGQSPVDAPIDREVAEGLRSQGINETWTGRYIQLLADLRKTMNEVAGELDGDQPELARRLREAADRRA